MKGDYDIAIIGAGTGGIGASIAAARCGMRVALVERSGLIGGTAAWAGVNNWEPGVGGTGLPFEIYRRLLAIPDSVAVETCMEHICWGDDFPGAFNRPDSRFRYRDSLQRHTVESLGDKERWQELIHCVAFEPDAYAAVVTAMLNECGVDCVLNTELGDIQVESGRVIACRSDDDRRITARNWIDATGGVGLLRQAGGTVTSSSKLNGVSLIARVSRHGDGLPIPDLPKTCWWRESFPAAHCNEYPNGDICLNFLPLMNGGEYREMDRVDARTELTRRLHASWEHVRRTYPRLGAHRITWIAPFNGVRESYRAICEYTLSADDVCNGVGRQDHPDIITLADHGIDRHGDRGKYTRVEQPYGVPYRCLLPRDFQNVLVACRGAGFDTVAASSCRLSRTMMQLGQAAGTAAALAITSGATLRQVDPEALRAALRQQDAQVDWPISDKLHDHLQDETAIRGENTA